MLLPMFEPRRCLLFTLVFALTSFFYFAAATAPQQYSTKNDTKINTDVSENGNLARLKSPLQSTSPASASRSSLFLQAGTEFLVDTPKSSKIDTNNVAHRVFKKGRGTNNAFTSSTSAFESSTRKIRHADSGFDNFKWKGSLPPRLSWLNRFNDRIRNSADVSSVNNSRHVSNLTIEMAVFVDKDLYKHFQANFPEDTQTQVTQIVLAMINAVQLLYQDPSLGHPINFVLKRLEVLEQDPPSLVRPFGIDRFLTNFCRWQRQENPASDSDPLHWDHGIMLTGLDVCRVRQSGKISNRVVGQSPMAGMCTRSSSCTVVEGHNFASVVPLAREIAHSLGIRDDGPKAENSCDPTDYIMSPNPDSGKLTWSECSKKYLELFLQTSQAKCLLDKAKPEIGLNHEGNGKLPGERFDADRQCVVKFGKGSSHASQQLLADICRDLLCRTGSFTWSSHPALEGTKCSLENDMWCRAGQCVPKFKDLVSHTGKSDEAFHFDNISYESPKQPSGISNISVALDGSWGEWSEFTDCSSACLSKTPAGEPNGIRLSTRRCDSFLHKKGGRLCSGPYRRYKICSANMICEELPTRTTVSQYATEVCSRAAQVDKELTGPGFMSSSLSDPKRACLVWCKTNDSSRFRSLGCSFPDGTACTLNSQPTSTRTFCVAGKCQEFNCNPDSRFRLPDYDCSPAFSLFLQSRNDIFNRNHKFCGWSYL